MKVMNRMWPLTPGIAVLHGSARHATAGVIQGSAGALLIDPGLFPSELYTLREQAQQWGGVQQVVVTHSHWDRLPGWASFPDAERIAHSSFVPCYVQQEQERQIDDQPSLAAFIQDFDHANHVHRAPLVVDAPTRTFDHVLHLELGNRTVRLLHLPGHTHDSTAVLLPNDGVMFVGDMLSDTTTPQVSDSGDYLRSLDLIQQFVSAGVVRTVVPGRGRVLCGAAEITAMIAADRSYILGVRDQLAVAMRRYRPTAANMEMIERSVSNWR